MRLNERAEARTQGAVRGTGVGRAACFAVPHFDYGPEHDATLRHRRPLADPRRVRAYIGLGANLGDREAALLAALVALAAVPDLVVRTVSDLYQTDPVGFRHQPPFLNAAAIVDVRFRGDPTAAALALLETCKEIERSLGRRPRRRWGPREIDLDILVFGRHRIAVGRPAAARDAPSEGGAGIDRRPASWLVVPHPEVQERLFVLAPLTDLAPRLVPPGWAETVAAARRRVEARQAGAVVRIGTWAGSGWVAVGGPGSPTTTGDHVR